MLPIEADRIEDAFSDPQVYPDPNERPRLAADALLEQYPTCQQQLESVTNYADLYGLLVESLKICTSPADVPEDLKTAFTAWAKGHISSDCLRQINLSAAVNHLIDIGCRRIAHFAGPDVLPISRNRLKGYKDALEQSGLGYNPELVIQNSNRIDFEEGYTFANQLLDLPERPDAIFANHDLSAIGAMRAIKDRGLRIPEDLAVVGFSNWLMSSYTEPSLTTVSQPGFEMGQEAARLFIQQMKHDDIETYQPVTKVLKTKLIVRDSTRR